MFAVDKVAAKEQLREDYNVSPGKNIYAVLARPNGDTEPVRRLSVVRWGLVPSWAKDAKIGNRLVNARIETVHEKPAFRSAFKSKRCLIPADGYYEWYGEVKGKKQPFFIRPRDTAVADDRIRPRAGLYGILVARRKTPSAAASTTVRR